MPAAQLLGDIIFSGDRDGIRLKGDTPFLAAQDDLVPTLWVITSKLSPIPEHINHVLFKMDA